MKQLLFLFSFCLSTIFLSPMSFADVIEGNGGSFCKDPFPEINLLGNLIGGECIKGSKVDCECLLKKANNNGLLKSKEDPAKSLASFKGKSRTQLMSAYEKMITQAKYQETILNIPKNSNIGNVSCTPKDMAVNMDKALGETLPKQLSALESDLLFWQKKAARLKAGTIFSFADFRSKDRKDVLIEHANKKIEIVSQQIKSLKLADCSAKLDLLKKAKFETGIPIIDDIIKSDLTPADIDAEFRKHKTANSSGDEKDDIDAVVKFCERHAKIALNVMKVEFDVRSKKRVKEFSELAGEPINVDLDNDQNSKPHVGNCSFNDGEKGDQQLCELFEKINFENDEQLKKDDKLEEATGCVTFAQFMTLKSMPEKPFLDALSKNSDPVAFILGTGGTGASSEAESSRSRFLSGNPLLAKILASKSGASAKLGEALKNFSNTSAGISDSNKKMKAYLDFLQNEVSKIASSDDGLQRESNVCVRLANDLAAINLATSIPIDSKAEDKPVLESVGICEKRLFNESSPSDISKTLKISPIFGLGDVEPVKSHDDLLKEFDTFKNQFCANDFKKFAATKCKSLKGSDACRKEFWSQQNNSKSSVASVVNSPVKSSMSKRDWSQWDHDRQESSQNHAYKKWWNENVGSKISRNVLADRDDKGEFESQRQAEDKFTSGVKVPESVYRPETQPVTSTQTVASKSPTSGASASPSNVLNRLDEGTPSSTPAPVNFANVDNKSTINNVIPNYNNLQTPQLKQQALQDAREVLEKSSSSLKPEQRVAADNILDKEEEKVKEEIKVASNDSKPSDGGIVNAANPAQFTGSRMPASSVMSSGASSIATVGGQNVAKITKAPKKTPEKIRNETLLQNYKTTDGSVADEKILVKGTVPALVLTESTPIVQGGDIDPGQLRVVNGEYGADVVSLDVEQYNKLQSREPGSDQVLKDLLVKKYKDSPVDEQVIQINNPTPDKYLLYRLVAKGNSFALERVVVKNSYVDLINTMGNTTGVKVQRKPASKTK